MGMKAGNLPHWKTSLEENAFKKYEVYNKLLFIRGI